MGLYSNLEMYFLDISVVQKSAQTVPFIKFQSVKCGVLVQLPCQHLALNLNNDMVCHTSDTAHILVRWWGLHSAP